MNSITIRLPESLFNDLKNLSRAEQRAVSEIVRDSLRRHVAIQKFRALRDKAMPYAESQGFLTDDDVFRALS